MLQFITEQDPRVDVERQVKTALLGGAKWIQTGAPRHVLEKLVPLCKDSQAFLITEGDLDLVEEFRVHGVHLTHATAQDVKTLRERLGGHAVVGVEVSTLDEAKAFKGLDVDYITFAIHESDDVDRFAAFAAGVQEAKLPFHIVASGDFPNEMLTELIDLGANAVAMGWGSFAQQGELEVAPADVIEQEAARNVAVAVNLLNDLKK